MADKYDNNGYNSGDFKRNSKQDASGAEQQDGDDFVEINEKAGEYMKELLSEKIKLNNSKFPITTKLIDQEVTKVQATGRIPGKDAKYLDVYREKPTKVTVKVLVPVKEHPKFNFVGKLLGPKGNTMKSLQEETMCKMAVLGRGSMKDRQKEEELRNSLDPKYAHLSDELHVEISALAPPAEAHARIAYALAEVKKYLVPDTGDMIWQTQMGQLERGPPGAHPFRGGPGPGRAPRAPRMPPAPGMRPPHAKAKVISILDRARTAMEPPFAYDDGYSAPEPPQIRGPPRASDPEFFYDRNDRYYDDEPYYKDEPAPSREYKASSREVGTRRPAPHGRYAAPRPSPYARPK